MVSLGCSIAVIGVILMCMCDGQMVMMWVLLARAVV